jgi:hypothetical protein
MARKNFEYQPITQLYNSSKVVIDANKGTYTQFTADIILNLRADIDYLGELLSETGSNWTANHYNWTKGSTSALDLWANGQAKHWTSYITDLRNAVTDLWATAGLSGSPSWTISTANIKPLYDSSFDIITANKATYTDIRMKSLYEDVRDNIGLIADTLFIYADSVNGNDTTGDGTFGNPYQTLDKAIDTVNASGGNIALMSGSYTVDSSLTNSSTLIKGTFTDSVYIDIPPGKNLADGADNLTLRYLYFGDGTAQDIILKDCKSLDIKYCVFRAATSDNAFRTSQSCTGTLDHCTLIGVGGSGSRGGFNAGSSTNLNYNNCFFKDVIDGVEAQGTIVFNYSAFEGVTNKTDGSASFTNNNEVDESGTEPNIRHIDPAYLQDASDLIDAGSDSFDVGAYEDAPYDLYRTASDSISMSESPEMKATAFASDTVTVQDIVTDTDMNVSIDLMMAGLFEAESNGDMTYITASNIISEDDWIETAGNIYNGAFLDVSFDNAGGDLCEVHIVVDDGVTDYAAASWWSANANNAAISTTQTVGTRGYGIDLVIESEAGDEWGDGGDFSTVTADGVNNQQWDITLQVRVFNTISGQWSEMVEVTKTYNFNTFHGTMYYHHDNPRMVDNEYANHANYLAQPYHTSTNKYTSIDGVDWIDDPRRFAYNPMCKSVNYFRETSLLATGTLIESQVYTTWQDRNTGGTQPFGRNVARRAMALYTMPFGNFGNYNDSSDHCFADKTNEVFDGCTGRYTNPPLDTGATDPHYIRSGSVQRGDCAWHGSHATYYIILPSGEMLSRGDFTGEYVILASDELLYKTDASPFDPPCSFGSGYYLWEEDNVEALYDMMPRKSVQMEVVTNDGGFGLVGTNYTHSF